MFGVVERQQWMVDVWFLLFRMNKEREMDDSDCVTVVEMQMMYGHEHHFHLCAVFKWIYISNHLYLYSYMIFYNMKFLFFGNSYKYWWFVVLFIIRSLYRCSIYTTHLVHYYHLLLDSISYTVWLHPTSATSNLELIPWLVQDGDSRNYNYMQILGSTTPTSVQE